LDQRHNRADRRYPPGRISHSRASARPATLPDQRITATQDRTATEVHRPGRPYSKPTAYRHCRHSYESDAAASRASPPRETRWPMIVKSGLPSYLAREQVRRFLSVITSLRDRALFSLIYLWPARLGGLLARPCQPGPGSAEDPHPSLEERHPRREASLPKTRDTTPRIPRLTSR
jgi:hypothetical protein